MASINSLSSSYYSQLVAKNKGIGGLASGLDTEALIEAMTLGTRTKIAKAGQQKQQTQWKQDAYRSVLSAMTAFQNKYFKVGEYDIRSQNFFAAYKANYTSNKIKVTTDSNSTTTDFKISQIKQLATAQTIKGKESLTINLAGDKSFDELATLAASDSNYFTNKTLKMDMGGKVMTVKLDDLNGLSASAMETKLQELIDAQFGKTTGGASNIKIEASDAGKIKFTSSSGQIYIAEDSDLGFTSGQTNRLNKNKTTLGEMGLALDGDEFEIEINGKTLSFTKDTTLNDLIQKVNSSGANVRLSYSALTGELEMTATATGVGDNIRMSDTKGNLLNQLFGSRSAAALNSGDLIKQGALTGDDIGSLAEIQEAIKNKGSFSLTINGTTKSVAADFSKLIEDGTLTQQDIDDGNYNMSHVVSALNKGIEGAFGDNPGVTVSLSGNKLSFAPTAADTAVTVKSNSSKDLGAALGLSEMTNVITFENQKSIDLQGLQAPKLGTGTGEYGVGDKISFTLTINGREETVTWEVTQKDLDAYNALEVDDDSLSATEKAEKLAEMKAGYVTGKLNEAIYGKFGTDAAYVSGNNVNMMVAFKAGANGEMELVTDKSLNVNIASAASDDLFGGTSFSADNRPTALSDYTLGDLGITTPFTLNLNGTSVAINSNMNLGSFMDTVNAQTATTGVSVRYDNNRLVIDGGDSIDISGDTAGTDFLTSIFGTGSYQTTPEGYGARNTLGQNAEVVLDDGTVISHHSNTITINGAKVEVLDTHNANGENDTPIGVNVVSDPDEIVDKLKEFMEEYNGMIAMIRGMYTEKANSEYAPLTDEQRSELSKDEIEKWEAEAKKGILQNDSLLRGILNSVRTALYNKPDPTGLSLYDLGIDFYGVFDKNNNADFTYDGQLRFVDNEYTGETGEEKLRRMIETNLDGVKELFQNTEKGLSVALEKAINSATNDTSDTKTQGTLISMAGSNKWTRENFLDKKITSIDENLARLRTRLETEYNRYWAKFSALETALSKLSSQSSWLADFSGQG